MATLTLNNLTKQYAPEAAAVADLNLTIAPGELMVLLGPSGSGKTTTLRLIAGLLQPSAGDICLNGRSILTTPPERREAVMVFQEDALFPFMTVGENVAYGLKMRGIGRLEIQRRVAESLAEVQLAGWEGRWPSQLSGGQRQRVSLARALVIRPQLLLLDEPLSQLDRPLRQELRQMICRLQRRHQITTLFVTHDQAEAFDVADRIGILFEGCLRQVDRPWILYDQPADVNVARFLGACNIIPGIKNGQTVSTALGQLEVQKSGINDGAVLVTVRPEAIELSPNGHNNFNGRIEALEEGVPTAACWVSVNGVPLRVHPPRLVGLRTQQTVTVHLPSDRLCILPPEEQTIPQRFHPSTGETP